MSKFKVGDLVECIDDLPKINGLTAGKKYKILEIYQPLMVVDGGFGTKETVYIERFKLVEPKLKVGDKVKSRLAGRCIFTVYQIIDQVVFLNVGCSIESFKLSDLEKVEEKTAPPKFTKVYVWDGNTRPEHPRIQYSYGEIKDGKLRVFCASLYLEAEYYYENWEVIG